MPNDLRQRKRNEDHSSTSNEMKIRNFSRYKLFQQYFVWFGLTLIISFGSVHFFRYVKSSLFEFDFSDEKFYPTEILHLFQSYDRDENHFLSLDEFEPFAAQFLQKRFPIDYQQPILNSDQLVTINAFFQPLNLSTMTKNFNNEFLVKRKTKEKLSSSFSLLLE